MSALFTRNRVIGLIVAAIICAADQLVKYWVAGPLGLKNIGDKIDLLPFFDLTRVHNQGVSLGMFQATSPEMRYGLIAVTAAIACVVLVWLMRERKMGDIFGLSLILGGAIGNIYDRWSLGYVLDYADFHIGDFRPFLVFNIADAAITIGVVIILARSLFVRDTDEDKADGPAETKHA
ncbi:MAG: signal peptidase II [Pseudomonadota bacterium]